MAFLRQQPKTQAGGEKSVAAILQPYERESDPTGGIRHKYDGKSGPSEGRSWQPTGRRGEALLSSSVRHDSCGFNLLTVKAESGAKFGG